MCQREGERGSVNHLFRHDEYSQGPPLSPCKRPADMGVSVCTRVRVLVLKLPGLFS